MIKGIYRIEKYPGKGGWHYIPIPEINQDKSNPFGWVSISGSIDGIPFQFKKLMPMGNGKLFFSINVQLRKELKKQKGDSVELVITQNPKIELSSDILESIRLIDDKLLPIANSLSENERIQMVQPIYDSKNEQLKIKAINKLIDFLVNYNH